MRSVIGTGCFAATGPRVLGRSAKAAVLGAGALVAALLSSSAAQAQCAGVGLSPPPGFPTGAAATAVAGVSAYVGTLAASIHSANTVFLSQSSAFVAAPPNPAPDQEGGGVWTRGVGGHLSFGTTATAGNINFGGSVPGNVVCNTRTLVDFAGVQVGTDIARLNVNGWNIHAGSTAGFLGSKTRDATPSTAINPPASFHDDLQIPFAGVYIAASNGGFLVDAQLRGMFFQNDVSDANHGMSGQGFDARGISLTGNIAYNYDLGNRWFVEPSAGIIWSRTQVDRMNVPGTIVYGTGGIPPWVLTVKDIESTLGRLSVRVGTSMMSGNVVLQPFASASVFHEFQGEVNSSLVSDFSAVNLSYPTLSSTVSASGPRTYGQFGLGIASQALGSGWVSYLRGDYRTGDHIEGWGLNGGLRYQFVPEWRQPIIAKAPVYKSPAGQAAYQWTGFYVGGQLGAGWGSTSWAFDGFAKTDMHAAGLLGGGNIGFDYQLGRWVLGVQGDMNWTHVRAVAPCPNGFFYNCEAEMNWLATVTGRIGYAYWDRLLLYAKAGVAIARDRDVFVCNTGAQPTPPVILIGCPSRTDSNTKAGWTVGWGSEFGLTRNVSVSGEVSYFNLGSERTNLAGTPAEIQRDGFVSSVGLHFRFGG